MVRYLDNNKSGFNSWLSANNTDNKKSNLQVSLFGWRFFCWLGGHFLLG